MNKPMKRYAIYGNVTGNLSVTINAESPEQALDILNERDLEDYIEVNCLTSYQIYDDDDNLVLDSNGNF